MSFVKQNLGKWIIAVIILVCGILCIVAGAKLGSNNPLDAKDALDAVSNVLGTVLIVVGALALCLAIFVAFYAQKGFGVLAMPGALVLALGISLVVAKYAGTLIWLLLTVVPYLMIAFGAVILVDAILNLVKAVKANKVKACLLGLVVAFVIAIAAIVLGALCIGEDPVIANGTQLIVFGIIVCLIGALKILTTFVKLPDTVVIVSKN